MKNKDTEKEKDLNNTPEGSKPGWDTVTNENKQEQRNGAVTNSNVVPEGSEETVHALGTGSGPKEVKYAIDNPEVAATRKKIDDESFDEETNRKDYLK